MGEDLSKHSLLLRAVNHSLALVSAAVVMAFCWFFFRPPDVSITLVTGTMLCVAACYDVQAWRDRFLLCFFTILSGGIFQLLIGLVIRFPVLVLLAGGIGSFFFLTLFPNRACAYIVILMGMTEFNAGGGFRISINVLADCICVFMCAVIVCSIVTIPHVPDHFSPPFPGACTAAEAVRFSILFLFGLWLMQLLRIPDGVWIPMTLVYLNLNRENVRAATTAKRLARFRTLFFGRIFGTPAGLICGFLFLGCFTYFEYRLIYLMPAVIGIGYFIQYYVGNYFLYTLCFMMAFCLYSDFAAGTLSQFQFGALIAGRSLATVIGSVLSLIQLFPFREVETA